MIKCIFNYFQIQNKYIIYGPLWFMKSYILGRPRLRPGLCLKILENRRPRTSSSCGALL